MIAASHLWETFYAAHLRLKGSGAQVAAKCPFHEDSHESLSVNLTSGAWTCHAGCGHGIARDFADRLGVAFAPPGLHLVKTEEKTWDYVDEQGRFLFQVVKRALPDGGKKFSQRRRDEHGEWVFDLKGVRRVLYRLPQVLASTGPVYVVEGEKDADTLCAHGLTATCNSGGAGKWLPEYNRALRGRTVYIVPDNDKPGRDHADLVMKSLLGTAQEIHILDLPSNVEKGDVTDWLNAGRSINDFAVLAFDSEPVYVKPAPRQKPKKRDSMFVKELPSSVFSGLPGEYVRLMADTTEAPDVYHLGTFLAVVGAALGKGVWAWNGVELHPNLYVLLVGDSGLNRKSTAARRGARLLKLLDPGIDRISDFGSAEKLIDMIGASDQGSRPDLHKRAFIHLNELAATLAKLQRDGAGNIVTTLINLYDCEEDQGTPTRGGGNGTQKVQNPIVSMLACSAESWLQDQMKLHDIRSGFANRFVCFGGAPKSPNPSPRPFSMEHLAGSVKQALLPYIGLAATRKQFTWGGPALKRWEEFYREWHGLQPESDVQAAITARVPDNALKMALIYAALHGEGRIDAADLECGINLSLYSAGVMDTVMGEVAASAQKRIETSVERQLRAAGTIGRTVSELSRSVFNASNDIIRRILKGLESDGVVYPVPTGRSVRWVYDDGESTVDVAMHRDAETSTVGCR